MTQNDIDRILTEEDHITPSPRFVEHVMQAVHREAAAPPPIAFPWLRALPGFAAAFAALIAVIWNGIITFDEAAASATFDQLLVQLTNDLSSAGLLWLLLATAVTIVSVTLPLGLMRFSVYARH